VDLLKRHGQSDDRVALVGHGGFYQYLMGAILGLEDLSNLFLGLSNTGISRIDFDLPSVTVVYLNRVDHLPPGLIS